MLYVMTIHTYIHRVGSLFGIGSEKRVLYTVYHEGRTRVNMLNTTGLEALDSPDMILYRSKHVSSGFGPRNIWFDREETALQYNSTYNSIIVL